MPSVPSHPRVKLRAATRRIPRARAAEATDDPEPEPNMKLSRAIFVMLLLHIVAIGGVIAFSMIKEHGGAHRGDDGSSVAEAEDLQVPTAPTAPRPSESTRPSVHVVQKGETLMRIANENGVSLEALVAANGAKTTSGSLHPGQEIRLPAKITANTPPASGSEADAMQLIEGKAADANNPPPAPTPKSVTHLPPDSGKTYVIGKGESAYTIAKKLKVTPEALLKLNGIDDPKRLKPGQKLRVPKARG